MSRRAALVIVLAAAAAGPSIGCTKSGGAEQDVAPRRSAPAAHAERTFTVVRARDGAPVAGASIVVHLRDGDAPPLEPHVADEHGRATIAVTDDVAWVEVRADGFAPSYVLPGETTVQLAKGRHVSGVVRDTAGRPIAGARLSVERFHSTGDSAGATIDPGDWSSDSDGRFTIDDIAPNSRDVTYQAEANGFAPWRGWFEFGDDDAVVELRRTGVVHGVVLRPDGAPASSAKIKGQTVDSRGEFEVEVVAGRRTISATWMPRSGRTLDELFGAVDCDVPEGGEVKDVAIRLAPMPVALLRVVDSGGTPVSDAYLSQIPDAHTELQGDVLVLHVERPVGSTFRERIVPRLKGWPEIDPTLTVHVSGEGAPTEVRLAPRCEFTAGVTTSDGGTLSASSRLRMHLDDGSLGAGEPWTTSVDSATWSVDPSRPCVLSIHADGYVPVRRDLASDRLRAGRMDVRLERGRTVRVRIVSSGTFDSTHAYASLIAGGNTHYAVREREGSLRFDDVAPGALRLHVEGSGITLVDRVFDGAAASDVDLGDVVVPSPTTIRGVVRRPDGRPCPGACVEFREKDTTNDYRIAAAVNDAGEFEVNTSPARSGRLAFGRQGLGGVTVDLARVDPAKPLAVQLVPGGTLDVRVHTPSHRPVACFRDITAPDGSPLFARWVTPDDRLGFDDRFVVDTLPAGDVVLKFATCSVRATVVAGKTTEVVVDEPK